MGIQFAVLSSGSEGNTFFVRSASTAILIDAGVPIRQVIDRLGDIGENIMDISAICVSHSHLDHSKSLRAYVEDYHVPVYCSAGTRDELVSRPVLKLPTMATHQREPDWRIMPENGVVAIGDLRMTSFPIPHDAAEPCGFFIKNQTKSVAIATDLGWVNDDVAYWLKEADIALLESNHDVDMLLQGQYLPALKKRVHQWHLSNEQAFELIDQIPEDRNVFVSHISRGNNTLERINTLRRQRENIRIVPPGHASPVLTV